MSRTLSALEPQQETPTEKRTCKPSSVPLYVSRGRRSFIWDRSYLRPQSTYPRVERSGPLLLFYLVFLRVGFTKLSPSPAKLVSSYLTFSPLPPPKRRRYIFCGTFLGVTPTGRYPAPCPVEPGLSSNARYAPAIAPSALPSTMLHRKLFPQGIYHGGRSRSKEVIVERSRIGSLAIEGLVGQPIRPSVL